MDTATPVEITATRLHDGDGLHIGWGARCPVIGCPWEYKRGDAPDQEIGGRLHVQALADHHADTEHPA